MIQRKYNLNITTTNNNANVFQNELINNMKIWTFETITNVQNSLALEVSSSNIVMI
jgi:hypothetical protein